MPYLLVFGLALVAGVFILFWLLKHFQPDYTLKQTTSSDIQDKCRRLQDKLEREEKVLPGEFAHLLESLRIAFKRHVFLGWKLTAPFHQNRTIQGFMLSRSQQRHLYVTRRGFREYGPDFKNGRRSTVVRIIKEYPVEDIVKRVGKLDLDRD